MFGRRSRTEQLFHEIMRRLSTADQQFEDTRQFTRDMMRRIEKVTDDHTRAMDAVVRELRDLTAESRAQRKALLQVIDRMDRLDPGGSAA